MEDNNSLSKLEYIITHIFFIFCSGIWFSELTMRSYPGLTYNQTRLVLAACLLVLTSAGIVITWKDRRNYLSLYVNIAGAYDIYFLVMYGSTAPILSTILIAVSAAFAAGYAVLLLPGRSGKRVKKADLIQGRIVRWFYGTRTVTVCCVSVLVIVLEISALFNILYFAPTVADTSQNDGEQVTIADNIEALSLLREEQWQTLSMQEKLEVLQVVADIEASYLGLPHELNIVAEPIDEITLGSYDTSAHMIRINIDHLETGSPYDVLKTLCHEARHAYQHCLCDVYTGLTDEQKNLLIFRNVEKIILEFIDPVDGHDDSLGYYSQLCETDARSYAAEAADEYYSRINEYLGIGSTETSDEAYG